MGYNRIFANDNNDFFSVNRDSLASLRDSVKRILLTAPGERVGEPDFGSNLKLYLFESDYILRENVIVEIVNSIVRWEPRVDIVNIDLDESFEDGSKIFFVNILLREKENFELFGTDLVITDND